jgi:hypothetical protein
MGGGLRIPSKSLTISATAREAVRRSAVARARMTVAFDSIDVLHGLLLLPVGKALPDTEKDEETGSFFKRLLLWRMPWLAIGNAWNLFPLVFVRLKT